jgi:nucleotide-binding universal stress UspA family protein
MKNILIATDFSDAAKNAANYLVDLYAGKEYSILLYHSYHIPVPTAPEPVFQNFEGLEADSLASLTAEKERLQKKTKASIDCINEAGFAVDNILETENERHPDLIVMGMESAGYLSEHLLGSIATAFVSRTATPVLIVPSDARYKKMKKIAFACDYHFDPNGEVLWTLKKFNQTFGTEVLVMNFLKKKDLGDSEQAAAGILLENYFKDINHSYYFMENTDFVKGVEDFARAQDADLIAIIPHRHSFLAHLFREGHTKKLAFHSHLPLLVIPETAKTH